MTKKKKSVEEHLPKRPPKKTGKKGVGQKPEPLDPVKDFEELVKKEPEAESQGSTLLSESPQDAKKQPRQKRLPTMEDPQIEELENSAENYADIRDQRMELTREESAAKEELLALMKKHKKTSYVHDGFDIKVIVESEKLRVRIKKED